MNRFKKFSAASVVAALLSSTAAHADVTGQEVWSAWRDMLVASGYEVSGTEAQSGSTLTVSDLALTIDLAPEEGSAVATLGEMRFVDQGDGSVKVEIPTSFPINVNVKEDGETNDVTLQVTFEDPDVMASGDPEDITYAYSASAMSVALAELLIDGEPFADLAFNATMNTLDGVSSIAAGDVTQFAQKVTAESMNFVMTGDDPEEGKFDLQADLQSLAFDGTGKMPMNIDTTDPVALFRGGFDVDGTMSQAGATIKIMAEDESGPTNVDIVSGAGLLDIKIGEGVFDYDGSVKDMDFSMIGGGSPLPVSVTMDEFGYGLLMPLLASTSPQPFDASFKLAGLTVSDMLWGIFDPAGQLPRDPATVAFDMTGTATVFEDLVSEDMEDADEFPGELNSLTLNSILIDAVGAMISGDGAFTFDNTDMATFDGLPRPEGSVTLNMKGINGLLDTLVAMGLLPEDQVMGARMMMAMFTVPGAGEDEMSSVIEINAEGHVLANGQRIQ